jgi:hypothetical protein
MKIVTLLAATVIAITAIVYADTTSSSAGTMVVLRYTPGVYTYAELPNATCECLPGTEISLNLFSLGRGISMECLTSVQNPVYLAHNGDLIPIAASRDALTASISVYYPGFPVQAWYPGTTTGLYASGVEFPVPGVTADPDAKKRALCECIPVPVSPTASPTTLDPTTSPTLSPVPAPTTSPTLPSPDALAFRVFAAPLNQAEWSGPCKGNVSDPCDCLPCAGRTLTRLALPDYNLQGLFDGSLVAGFANISVLDISGNPGLYLGANETCVRIPRCYSTTLCNLGHLQLCNPSEPVALYMGLTALGAVLGMAIFGYRKGYGKQAIPAARRRLSSITAPAIFKAKPVGDTASSTRTLSTVHHIDGSVIAYTEYGDQYAYTNRASHPADVGRVDQPDPPKKGTVRTHVDDYGVEYINANVDGGGDLNPPQSAIKRNNAARAVGKHQQKPPPPPSHAGRLVSFVNEDGTETV